MQTGTGEGIKPIPLHARAPPSRRRVIADW